MSEREAGIDMRGRRVEGVEGLSREVAKCHQRFTRVDKGIPSRNVFLS